MVCVLLHCIRSIVMIYHVFLFLQTSMMTSMMTTTVPFFGSFFVIHVVTIGRLWKRSTEDPHGSDIHPMVPKRFSPRRSTFFFERKELRVDDHIIDKPFKWSSFPVMTSLALKSAARFDAGGDSAGAPAQREGYCIFRDIQISDCQTIRLSYSCWYILHIIYNLFVCLFIHLRVASNHKV